MLDTSLVPLSDIGRLVTGRTPPSNQPQLFGSGAAFITPSDISDQSIFPSPERRLSNDGEKALTKVLLPPGAVCFTCIASIGKMCLTREISATNQQINSIIVNHERYDPRWVFYALKANRDRIANLASGSATPIINKTSFGRVSLAVPNLQIQRRVAEILGTYDSLIEVNRRRVALLEDMVRGLFEEWFVRFRYPGHESVGIIDTPIGPVPSGWKHVRLDDLLVLQRGFDLPASTRSPGLFNVISASGRHGTHAEAKVKGPGIVTGRSGTIGKVHLVFEDHWPLNTTLYVKEYKHCGPAFAYQLLVHLDLASKSSGSAVPTLNRNHVHGLLITVPCDDTLDRFEHLAMGWLTLAKNLTKQSEHLATARDLLLPRLISGQLSVAAAERELLEAA